MPDPTLCFLRLPDALQGKITLVQLNTFMEALDYESDRGLVLTIAAICDELCLSWLKEIFHQGNSKVRKDSFDFRGAFGTFSARGKTLFALGKIDKAIFDDLELIRDLRNKCAHEWSTFRLTKELVMQFVDPLFRGCVELGNLEGSTMAMKPQHKMRWVGFKLINALATR